MVAVGRDAEGRARLKALGCPTALNARGRGSGVCEGAARGGACEKETTTDYTDEHGWHGKEQGAGSRQQAAVTNDALTQ